MREKKRTGWIKLHRSIMENRLYFKQTFTDIMAWIDLLMLANHKDNYIIVTGNRIDIKRGQVGYSQKQLAERWKWSRGKVKRFLNWLESDTQIEQVNVQADKRLKTIISITNYEDYQGDEQDDRQVNGQKTDTSQTDDDTVTRMKKNEKELLTDNAPKSSKRKRNKVNPVQSNPPSIKEICEYCDSQEFDPDYINPWELYDFYVTDKDESLEWTYKDGKPVMNWKSLFRNIHNSNKKAGKKVNTGFVQDQGKNPSEGYGRMGTDFVMQATEYPPNRHPDDPIARHEAMADVEEVVIAESGNVYVRRGNEWFDRRDSRIHPAYYDPNNEDYDVDCKGITEAEAKRP